jgi:hypothetical protein
VLNTRPKKPVGGPGWVNGSFTMVDSTRVIFTGAPPSRIIVGWTSRGNYGKVPPA